MEKNNLKISVIIPTYKRAEKLVKAINSVLGQTYKNIEIIVIDDNNPESKYRKTTEILMKDFLYDYRIKYLKHNANMGGAAARNTGIKNSSGDIISFLDDDDSFLPGKTKRQIEFLLTNKDFKGVYCGSIRNGKEISSNLQGNLTEQLLLFETTIFTPTIMLHKSAVVELNGFNENFKRHQDYEFLLRFFEKYKIGVIEDCLVRLGNNEGENILHGKDLEVLKKYFLTQFDFKLRDLEKDNPGITKRIYCRNYSKVFLSHLKHGHYKLALNLCHRLIIRYPKTFCIEVFWSFFKILEIKLHKL